MIISELCGQTWTLTKKELLLIARRRWLSTFIRAVAFPIVLTAILASVKTWIHNDGGYGTATPSPIRTLSEAFAVVGDTRKQFVIVDRGLQGADVRAVIDELDQAARDGGRNVQFVTDSRQLIQVCPSSSKGVTSCFGAIDFWSSPDQGPNAIWNYTIWQDSVIAGADVRSDANPAQLYTIPLQRAVDSMISRRNNGTALPDTVLQYPFTSQTQAAVDFRDDKFFGLLITQALGFALFLAMCGITYHLTGHVVWQREAGLLQLIDAQMPNTSRWECLVARMFATHLAFDLIYMPAWIICGAVVGTIIYPHSNAVVAAIAFAIVAQFTQSGQKSTQEAAVIATGLLFPPSSFVYFLVSGAVSEIFSLPLTPHQSIPSLLGGLLEIRVWSLTPAHFLGFFAFQIALYPILAIFIERFLWGCSFRGRHLRSAPEMAGNALRIKNFTKRYNGAAKKRDRTLAVEDLSLDVYAGTIMVLLGQNGCGKSTTLSCIAGLESITEGTIELDGTGGVGLCPQKNVIWPDMTVEEHVRFFEHLKKPSCRPSQAEVDRLIDGCDLKKKTHASSKTLSGGQQRKLQLCMMLAGAILVTVIWLTNGYAWYRIGYMFQSFKDNKAVDDVSFGIMPSEKFALLGPNGAGKSTLISLIRGDLQMDGSSSNAEIHIAGDSLISSPVAAKQHLGVCPQFDAVDSMTLKEHLEFYAQARGLSSKEKDENINKIISRLGLGDHTNKLVKKLSGGTKRKMSLGIALVGNPFVLLLDEPSSGMDAASKRALWSTLTAISEGRSLLITTHSMEEGDALCDRAGIMAGRMLALGTIKSLHERYSDKVYVHLVHQNAPRSTPEKMASLWQWVNSTFLVAETEKSVGGQARFAVPRARQGTQSDQLLDGSHLGKLFQAMEAHKERASIRDYSIGHATLDQVFVNVCQGVDEENSAAVHRGGGLFSCVLGRSK
ncbi:Retinal-specific phospholipid-transporting ATPase ABCA4 [Fulvia fulva]|uniref:Retinal-specific phospholipid-transporting ATPase ABCA4 n=1 Tax=Passalora fulva TaxID=5499 RepID=A0A9Q8LIS5_PASFU|nr:Retinal-specific phospholipid-transporting ATPase ABCA4 [Fulvia fulva]KAK4625533.1 Retinal-specific phospholipid-transporting ATPase ABCA4 [Fulvia fulva]UJO18260.1 Retinal-specific phospholipid-transporting ATPase ABCA4 [Fulvia fulva]